MVSSTLVLTWAFILNSIELSLQSEGSHNSTHISVSPRAGTSYSPNRRRSPERSRSRSRSPSSEVDPAGFCYARLLPVEYDPAWFPPSEFDPAGIYYAGLHPSEYSPTRHSSPGSSSFSEPPPPANSFHSKPSAFKRFSRKRNTPYPYRRIDPPTRLPSDQKGGYGLEHFKFIRLTSLTNPRRIFELRRYTFPADKSIKLRLGDHHSAPVPTQEQIVVSTSNGDIFAILESTNALAGIYIIDRSLNMRRVKINMKSETVTLLTKVELKETPVGCKRPITKYFRVEDKNEV